MDLARAAVLTWNLIGSTLFIGLPANVRVYEVCINWEFCVHPDNAQVVVVPWDISPESVIARFTRSDGSSGSLEAVTWPAFIG